MNSHSEFDRVKKATNEALKKFHFRINDSYRCEAPPSPGTFIFEIKRRGKQAKILKLSAIPKERYINELDATIPKAGLAVDKERSYKKELAALYALKASRYAVRLSSEEPCEISFNHVYCSAPCVFMGFLMEKYPVFLSERGGADGRKAIYNPIIEKWLAVYGEETVIAYVSFCVLGALLDMETEGLTIHRDIKPENLFISNESEDMFACRILLGDFGVAHKEQSLFETQSCFVGTPQYRPPENKANDADSSFLTYDIFMLGIVLHELLEGSLISKETHKEWFEGTAPIPFKKSKLGKSEVGKIIAKMTMAEPKKRAQNLQQLRKEFADILSKKYEERLPKNDLIRDIADKKRETRKISSDAYRAEKAEANSPNDGSQPMKTIDADSQQPRRIIDVGSQSSNGEKYKEINSHYYKMRPGGEKGFYAWLEEREKQEKADRSNAAVRSEIDMEAWLALADTGKK